MTNQSTTAPSCLSRLFCLSPRNALTHTNSPSLSTCLIAKLAATSLVTASAGLGSYYAWSAGSQHGWLLGGLFVMFAVGLEFAKPLAVSAAFTALRSWYVFRGAALTVLAIVAVAYSLTAELSLIATSRGDAVAQREAAIKATADAEQAARRATERYDRAKGELATLPTTRPAAELQADIDRLLLRPGTNGCVVIDGRVTKEVCPKVAELRTEKARAGRRAELEQILGEPVPAATAATTGQQAVSKPDPAASSLSTYLAVFGLIITPALLSEWLVLVPVIALELGSAFSVLLVQSFSGSGGAGATELVQPSVSRDEPVVQQQSQVPMDQGGPPVTTGAAEADAQAREKVKSAIVSQLQKSGGSVQAGERGLARLIGTNRSTMKRAINGLVMAGLVAAEATRSGTMLRLVT